jgi:hypothetical protein
VERDMKRTMVILLVLVIGAVLAWRSLTPEEARIDERRDRVESTSRDEPSVDELKAEIAALRSSQRALATKVRSIHLEQEAEREADPKNENQAEQPIDDKASAEFAEARIMEQKNLLQETFDQEPPDPQWAQEATELVEQRYSTEEFAGVFLGASCKTSLCRIDLQLPEDERMRSALNAVTLKVPWSSPGFAHVDLATSRTTFYLARKDHKLPQIPQVP